MSIATEITRIGNAKAGIITAIQGKGQTVPSGAKFEQLAALIAAIQTGIDTSDATAGPAEVLAGFTAYARGEKLVGTASGIKTASGTATIDANGDVTINAGFYVDMLYLSYSGGSFTFGGVSVSPSARAIVFLDSYVYTGMVMSIPSSATGSLTNVSSTNYPEILSRNTAAIKLTLGRKSSTSAAIAASTALSGIVVTWYAAGH